jgi:hypothetical protein
MLRLQHGHNGLTIGTEGIESIAVLPKPMDHLIFGILLKVSWEQRGLTEVWALQVVQEVTNVDKRKGHYYYNS